MGIIALFRKDYMESMRTSLSSELGLTKPLAAMQMTDAHQDLALGISITLDQLFSPAFPGQKAAKPP